MKNIKGKKNMCKISVRLHVNASLCPSYSHLQHVFKKILRRRQKKLLHCVQTCRTALTLGVCLTVKGKQELKMPDIYYFSRKSDAQLCDLNVMVSLFGCSCQSTFSSRVENSGNKRLRHVPVVE